ncbi:hypothetical protein KBC80_01130 [Candidatus Woesebacteria bacterium]|nr:hypothetical protein [Candidatus Woesebacteria bacterium]
MTHIESLPLDIPSQINEATGTWEQFGILGYEATKSLVNHGANPFLRGSRLTRMLIAEPNKGRFDEIRRLVRHSQRVVPSHHFGSAADPDTERPIDNQLEYKLPLPPEQFAQIVQGLKSSLGVPHDGKILDIPSTPQPNASTALRNSYERLKPRHRINWTEGIIPGRNMPYVGIEFETDWVGAGSQHITRIPLSYWRVYPTGRDTDMRNPRNCTNVDGLWGAIQSKNGVLTVLVPEKPTTVRIPESAIELHEKNITKGGLQAAINIADMLTRGLRIGASLGLPYTPEDTIIASNWMSRATPILRETPPSSTTRRYIQTNIHAAREYNAPITEEFMKQVDFTAVIS